MEWQASAVRFLDRSTRGAGVSESVKKWGKWAFWIVLAALLIYMMGKGVTWADVRDAFRAVDAVIAKANWSAWLILLGMITVIVVMVKMHFDEDSDFDFMDLIGYPVYDEEKKKWVKRVDSDKFMRFGAFVVSTAGFWYLVVDGKMSEFYFAGYMGAWVLNAIAGRNIKSKEIVEEIKKNGHGVDGRVNPPPPAEYKPPPPPAPPAPVTKPVTVELPPGGDPERMG